MTLEEFFKEHNRVALAFSGGVDSSYLLYLAKKYKAQVSAYYVDAQFQPAFELDDARKIGQQVGVDITVLKASVLEEERVVENPENRCYFCKQKIFSMILEAAKRDGFTEVMDGTNASDQVEDRPGMQALKELKIFSPLRLCGVTKEEVRRASKEAGLFTWDKPSYACLATRIPAGTRITQEDLTRVEEAEAYLHQRGFKDFRVRVRGDLGLIQVCEEQMEKALKERQRLVEYLSRYFKQVALDLQPRQSR